MTDDRESKHVCIYDNGQPLDYEDDDDRVSVPVPDPPLPDLPLNDVEKQVQMSRWFQEHVYNDLAEENHIQASEKMWAAVAHALKAIAIQRGWSHHKYSDLDDIARQIGHENGAKAEFSATFSHAEKLHDNIRLDNIELDVLVEDRADVEHSLGILEVARKKGAHPTKIETPGNQRRIARLLSLRLSDRPKKESQQLNLLLPIGLTCNLGFSPRLGYVVPDLSVNA